jgi:pyridoxal phosphate enzyme (YggS family)
VSEVADNLARVRARIATAAAAAGRPSDAVQLVAVTKGKPSSAIRDAYAVGQRLFGENYAQELVAKAAELVDLPELRWHFIGHLQTNKAKAVAPIVHAVHTVDSPALVRELAKRRVKSGREALPVLIEVNVTREPQKHGAAPSDLQEVIDAVRLEPALALRGLMTVPPADDLGKARAAFETLASLRALHGGTALLPELSMGMSHDLEVAVACGATLVRIGTAIFGPR